jgi:hypothetical protein
MLKYYVLHITSVLNSHFIYFLLTACVILWEDFLTTNPDVPSSVSGVNRFSEKYWIWKEGPLSLMRINEELFERKVGTSV